jgi:glutathione S-transferase
MCELASSKVPMLVDVADSSKLQPPIMPRPDVKALGIEYRRIPILAIGRDVYTDTRLILSKLEALYPASDAYPSLSTSTLESRAMEKLLEFWTVDGGIFTRAAQLIPTNLPLFKDPKFTNDRQQYSGTSWNKDEMEAVRPEALVEIKGAMTFLEKFLLVDGREWITNTTGPTLADIEGMRIF